MQRQVRCGPGGAALFETKYDSITFAPQTIGMEWEFQMKPGKTRTLSSDEKESKGRQFTNQEKEIEALLNSHKTRIKVVGCGGAGNNTLSQLVDAGPAGVVTIAINTDAQDLLYAKSENKILIGRDITNGLGAGSKPDIGEKSANENHDEITENLQGSDLVFVTCGLGGGTGTGSAPVVAEIAKKIGALTIAVVTLPFTEEGVMRWENAELGLARLRENADTVIVVQNDKLLEIAPDMPLNQAFKQADEILANAVKGITELVTEKGLVNLDFADISAVMKDGGTAMIGLGESETDSKALDAVEMAVQNPLLDVDITGAKSALINIAGGSEMSLKDARIVMKSIAERLDPAARVIWGARMDADMGNKLRVMLIVTGLLDDHPPAFSPEKAAAIETQDYKPLDELLTAKPDDVPPVESHNLPASYSESTVEEAMDPDPVEPDQTLDPVPKAEKPVFNKIFEEETTSDLQLLQRSIDNLDLNADNHKTLSEIKELVSALNNTAQLFAFSNISKLAVAVEILIEHFLNKELTLTENYLSLLKDVAVVFQGMVYQDEAAISEAKRIEAKLELNVDNISVAGELDTAILDFPAHEDVRDDDLKPSKDSLSFDDVQMKKGKVGDMVSYVRNLLNDDSSNTKND